MSVIDFYILYMKVSPFFNRSNIFQNISENIDAENVAKESNEVANSDSLKGGGEVSGASGATLQ